MTCADEKAALRRAMRERRRALSAETRAAASARICEKLLARSLGASVAVYLAGPDEVDLSSYLRAALSRGVSLSAPRWTGETYALAPFTDEADLRLGPHGIREPRFAASGEPLVPTTWLVPGLAFTRDGLRLGYGGGWYDRLLASADASARVVGVGYSFQIVSELPCEPHDVRLTEVIDET